MMAKIKKPKTRKKGGKSQSERFVEKARELGAEENGEAFERAFSKVVPPKTVKQKDGHNDPGGKQSSS